MRCHADIGKSITYQWHHGSDRGRQGARFWALLLVPAHKAVGNRYLCPLGWEHVNLTGDYAWHCNAMFGAGKYRPLRPLGKVWRTTFPTSEAIPCKNP